MRKNEFLSFFFFLSSFSGACVALLKPAPPTCVFGPRKRDRFPCEKKAKKKINFWWRKKKKCSPSLSHDVNVPRHPFLFFFRCVFVHLTNINKKKLSCRCVVQFFININNETLVWSEKDGGSAFAGGNDGQGDKLLTRSYLSFLSFLSLRGGVSRVFSSLNLSFNFSN